MRGLVLSLATVIATVGPNFGHAENCDLVAASNAVLKGRSYKVQIFSSAIAVVLGESVVTPEHIKQAKDFLTLGQVDDTTLTSLNEMLGAESTALDQRLMDRDAIKISIDSSRPPATIQSDLNGATVEAAVAEAQELYFKMIVRIKYSHLDRELVDRVFLLAVGPVLYAKTTWPEQMKNIVLQKIDAKAPLNLSSSADARDANQVRGDVLFVTPEPEFASIALNLVAKCQELNRNRTAAADGPGPTKAVPKISSSTPTPVPVMAPPAAPILRPIAKVRAPVFHAVASVHRGRARVWFNRRAPRSGGVGGPSILSWQSTVGRRTYRHWCQDSSACRRKFRRR